MAFYQSEQVIDFLAKAVASDKVTMTDGGDHQAYQSNVDGLILPNGDIYDRGQRFYARGPVAAPVQKPVEAPVVEAKVEAQVVEEKVEAPAPKPARKTAAKAAK